MPSTKDFGKFELMTSSRASLKRLVISAHGGYSKSKHGFTTPAKLLFYSYENHEARGKITCILGRDEKRIEPDMGEAEKKERVTDYYLSHYEHDTEHQKEEVAKIGFQVVTVKEGKEVHLSSILAKLKEKGYEYKLVHCLFCRVPEWTERVSLPPPKKSGVKVLPSLKKT